MIGLNHTIYFVMLQESSVSQAAPFIMSQEVRHVVPS
jgi:hypothetical protein